MHNLQSNMKPELQNARRALEELDGVEILEDAQWDPINMNWVLLCRLSPVQQNKGPIPDSTNWYVKIDDSYPWGKIKFVPAKIQGLKGTFPHQNYNGEEEKDLPWRDGDLCLDTSARVFRSLGFDSEPFDPETRLVWHFKRALLWLQAANNEELFKQGDPFEIPHFPKASLTTIAFSESPESYTKWKNNTKNYGFVEYQALRTDEPLIIVTKKFLSFDKKEIHFPSWGLAINDSSKIFNGMWIMLNAVPVLPPWQAPTTWGELQYACNEQGIDLLKILKQFTPSFRDGKPNVLLLGFPLQEKVGGEPVQIFWQPIQLPALSYGSNKIKGFRDIEKWHWFQDRNHVFGQKKKIHWLISENWGTNELYNRGKLHSDVTTSSILQIGAGAVGSSICELLVRAGQNELTIMDNDVVQPGNLVRHTLSLDDIYKPKVDALVKKLNKISPHARVKGINKRFTPSAIQDMNLDDYNVIIDCTGEDEVLHHLSQIEESKTKIFISVSLGYGAKRLFVFVAKNKTFPHAAFISLIQPWLKKEKIETASVEYPREGIGCWHPVFPARADDVWLMISTAIKSIESYILKPCENPELIVFEQKWNDEFFEGVSLISREVYNG